MKHIKAKKLKTYFILLAVVIIACGLIDILISVFYKYWLAILLIPIFSIFLAEKKTEPQKYNVCYFHNWAIDGCPNGKFRCLNCNLEMRGE